MLTVNILWFMVRQNRVTQKPIRRLLLVSNQKKNWLTFTRDLNLILYPRTSFDSIPKKALMGWCKGNRSLSHLPLFPLFHFAFFPPLNDHFPTLPKHLEDHFPTLPFQPYPKDHLPTQPFQTKPKDQIPKLAHRNQNTQKKKNN